MPPSPYHQLEDRVRRFSALDDVAAILEWDLATMMPPGAADGRSDQVAALKAVRHGMLTAPEMGDLIAAATAETGLDRWQTANLREIKRKWAHATALDEALVTALSKAVSACEMAWRQARADADFATARPHLERLLGLIREVAAAKADALGLGAYDALLDEFEPGGRADEIDAVFRDLGDFLPGFLGQVLERQAAAPPARVPRGPFPIDRQRALAVRLMEVIGFDFDYGRLDVSHHPFCGGTVDDVRITTRYDEDDFTSGLMGVLHETGHALYERGLPREWRGCPVGEALSTSIHESQSLLLEMQVCRSRGFLGFAAPVMQEAFDGDGPAWDADNLYRHYTRVTPGYIRVDADEVTYPAHVILRYRLEKAMIAGDLMPADLPGAWNEGMEDLLGLTPPSDAEGCLQDVHWYDGAWGYFPTYTLGAMAAAQIFDAARRADPAIEPGITAGDFRPLFTWLGAAVHSKGALLSSRELLTEATGRPLDPEIFKTHLERRYLA